MPTPIITLPIHTIEQARALAGILRAYIESILPAGSLTQPDLFYMTDAAAADALAAKRTDDIA